MLKIVLFLSWLMYGNPGYLLLDPLTTESSFGSEFSFQTSTDSSAVFKVDHVSFKSGVNQLQGRLIMPRQFKNKLPVVVFCVGSSKSSTMDVYKPFLDSLFIDNLPMDKVAIFYFDKRGVGKSEGKWHKTDFEGRAADAKAAADYLKTLPFIDKDRITIAGHSQGGWITQICMARYPDTFKAGLSLAGPTFDVREQIRNEYASQIKCRENIGEEEARRKALRKVDFHLFLATIFPIREEWVQLNTIKKFEPAKYLVSIEKPLWLLFGENDPLVSPCYSKAELKKIFPGGLPYNMREMTVGGANHSFKVAEFCHKGSTRNLSYSLQTKNLIREWAEIFLLD